MSDDNFGMYVTLPTESIRNILIPKYNPNLHAALAIGLAPSNVNMRGYAVEQSAASLATKIIAGTNPTAGNRWLQHLKEQSTKLVCRTLLADKTRYVNAMTNTQDDQGRKLSAAETNLLETNLPARFWVTEITVPNLYTGNKRKLGDILTAATATKEQFVSGSTTLLCWLPGMLLPSFVPALGAQGWSLFGHIPLLRGATQDRQVLEW